MSRYFSQLARETHSRLRPPRGLRLPPRAPVTFEEIYEERIVGPEPLGRAAPAPLASAQEPAPPPGKLAPVAEPAAIPLSTSTPSAPPRMTSTTIASRTPEPVPSNTRALSTPEPAARQPSSLVEPRVPARASTPVLKEPPARILDPTSVPVRAASRNPISIVHTLSFESEPSPTFPGPSPAQAPAIAESSLVRSAALPEPAPEALAVRRLHPTVPQRQTAVASPPAIDVTIGSIEVTIESPPTSLTTSRRSEPRASQPRPSPPVSGILARMYLDR